MTNYSGKEEMNMDAYNIGVLLGSILFGSLIGAVPAICGAIKQKVGLAVGGFLACLAAHFILGMLLSIPVAAVFLFFIFKKS